MYRIRLTSCMNVASFYINQNLLNKPFFKTSDCRIRELTFHDEKLFELLSHCHLILFHYTFETARYLSSLASVKKEYPETPIIITTEYTGEEILKWALKNGCPCDSEVKSLAKQKWPNYFID